MIPSHAALPMPTIEALVRDGCIHDWSYSDMGMNGGTLRGCRKCPALEFVRP